MDPIVFTDIELLNDKFAKGIYAGIEFIFDRNTGFINGSKIMHNVQTRCGNIKEMYKWKETLAYKQIVNYLKSELNIQIVDIQINDVPINMRGTYIHYKMVPIALCWANPILIDRFIKPEFMNYINIYNHENNILELSKLEIKQEKIKSNQNIKIKEKTIVDFILSTFPNYKWEIGKAIKDGVSGKIPDISLRINNTILIIEIDEHQHFHYNADNEHNRLVDLLMDAKPMQLYVIRFNPDKYYDKSSNNIASCWQKSKDIPITYKICNMKAWNVRLSVLEKHINIFLANSSLKKPIKLIKLFYDENR